MKKSLLIFVLFTAGLVTFAQQSSDSKAMSILDKASAKFSKAYACDIKLSVKDPDNDKITTQNMSVKLYGNKFYIKSGDMETFFDGKTQWVYYQNLNEVTITEPDAKELQQISPVAVIKNYKKNYKVLFDENPNTAAQYVVSLLPNDKTDDVFRIRIYVNKNTDEITKIEASMRNGQRMTFVFGAYRQITKTDGIFKFDEKTYPKVSINDLR